MNDQSGIYKNNVAGWSGGAVQTECCDTSVFTKSTFTGNHLCGVTSESLAADQIADEVGCENTFSLPGDFGMGGAIYAQYGVVRVYSSKFALNTSLAGGAIAAGFLDGYVERSTFTSNASTVGGAVVQGFGYGGGTLELNRNTFKLNHAYISGEYGEGTGGAFAGNTVRFTSNGLAASGNIFAGNTADGSGGGYSTAGGLVAYCNDLNEVTGLSDGFIHGVLPKSLGYWADGTFWEGTQTINYLESCTGFNP
jgi:hypothetical protein